MGGEWLTSVYYKTNHNNMSICGNLKMLYHSMRKTGGGSFQINSGNLNPDTGYSVSIKGYEARFPIPENFKDFKDQMNTYLYCFNYPDNPMQKICNTLDLYIGLWVHENMLYYDLSVIITNLCDAIKLCKSQNQLAFYDNKKKRTIFVKDDMIYLKSSI
jgi:hypothetical protein